MPTSLNPITQNDKIIASAVENNFNFLLTNFQSATAPSNPSNGQLWYDSTNNLLKVYRLSTTTWLTVGPASSSTIVTVSDTPPGSPSLGDLWFDTGTTLRLYVYTTASGGAWLDANPAAAGGSAADGGIPNQQIFTSSGTFTVPAGVTKVEVFVWGGGGGGGVGGYSSVGSGGGFCQAFVTELTPGTGITVTVGSGGAGAQAPNAGSTGGTSSFGTFVSATGGSGLGFFGAGAVSGAGVTLISCSFTYFRPSIAIDRGGNSGTNGATNDYAGLGGGPGFSGGGGGGGGSGAYGLTTGGAGGVAFGSGNAGSSGSGGSVGAGAAGGAGGSLGGAGGAGLGFPYYSGGGGGGGGGAVIVQW